jgi:hypothetical protein
LTALNDETARTRSRFVVDSVDETAEIRLIENVAAAIHDEFGDQDFDDFPGFRNPAKAGQLNRAYRASASCILQPVLQTDSDPTLTLSRILNSLARRRLETHGLAHHQIEHLLGLEGAERDDWHAFLILHQWAGIERLLADSQS